jgi:hypothetical protein
MVKMFACHAGDPGSIPGSRAPPFWTFLGVMSRKIQAATRSGPLDPSSLPFRRSDVGHQTIPRRSPWLPTQQALRSRAFKAAGRVSRQSKICRTYRGLIVVLSCQSAGTGQQKQHHPMVIGLEGRIQSRGRYQNRDTRIERASPSTSGAGRE